MRISLFNGNGMKCDNCGKIVPPKSKDMVKCSCLTPHNDDSKAYTGIMQTIGTADLCKDCYEKILGNIVHKPRKKYKKK